MGRTIAIIISAAIFAVMGLMASLIFALNFQPDSDDLTLGATFLPPVLGGLIGLIVGCVAAIVGHFTTRR